MILLVDKLMSIANNDVTGKAGQMDLSMTSFRIKEHHWSYPFNIQLVLLPSLIILVLQKKKEKKEKAHIDAFRDL